LVRRSSLLALAALPVIAMSAASAEDVGRHVAIETFVRPARSVLYVGETFDVAVEIRTDEWLSAHVARRLARPLDLDVQVDAPWLDAVPGSRRVAVPARGADSRSVRLVVNDATESAAAEAAPVSAPGRSLATNVASVRRRFVAERAGTIVLPAARLRFAVAERFEDDVVRGRVAIAPQDAVVESKPLSFDVRPLPVEGRPADFAGAVGRFTLNATCDAREVAAGDVFRATLRIEGDGDLQSLVPPRPRDSERFHVYGVRDDRGAEGRAARTVVYDVAALSTDVHELPPFELRTFDPEPPGAYVTVRSEAIPLTVSRAKPGTPLVTPTEDEPRGGRVLWLVIAGTLVAVVLGVVAVRIRAARSKGGPVGGSRRA
jgi:hypothetical protein